MTNSEIFSLAHARAKEDMAWKNDPANHYPETHPYAYYFRLHLIGLYAERKPMVISGPAAVELFGLGA